MDTAYTYLIAAFNENSRLQVIIVSRIAALLSNRAHKEAFYPAISKKDEADLSSDHRKMF